MLTAANFIKSVLTTLLLWSEGHFCKKEKEHFSPENKGKCFIFELISNHIYSFPGNKNFRLDLYLLQNLSDLLCSCHDNIHIYII